MSKSNELIERLRSYRDTAEAPSDDSLARREVADALRELCHAIGASSASPEQMRTVAAQLRLQGQTLAVTRAALRSDLASGPSTVPGMEDFHDRSPIAGKANPLAPPAILAIDRDASIVMGEVTFGAAFEGAPGCVHGGFVAAVLDEALGMASALSGAVCMTAELTTRYRQHTPVSAALRIEARLVSVEGRKVHTSGEVYHGEALIAEGRGLFIAVDMTKFQELATARADQAKD
jgi:acyl-coenzyme A thioesterase PaaI-like protein